MSKSKQGKTYVRKDPIEHVLHRPDMYVGSINLRTSKEFVGCFDDDKDSYVIKTSDIQTSPGILRVFIEVLSNAIDNVQRSKSTSTKCTYINVNIDPETGKTEIINDGDVIPIDVNNDENMYNHSLIFGNLLTSSNYNDDDERLLSGRFGLGVKLTNIFSNSFTVQGVDPLAKKKLIQTWTRNMKQTDGPIVTDETAIKKGYTKVSYYLDFKRFGLESYTQDIINQYMKYVIDTAMLTGVNVSLNGRIIEAKTLVDYAKMYANAVINDDQYIVLKSGLHSMLLAPCIEPFTVSFVNGVCTKLGGQHVDAWTDAVFKPLVARINKKNKPVLTVKDVRPYFCIFAITTVANPEFDSQDKNKLESPAIKVDVKSSEIAKILKWNVMEDIEDMIKGKELAVLRKHERKSKKIVKIDGYDPANLAGTANSMDCTLILCEGLSAKTYAVAGIEKGVGDKKGRDYFGVLSLRGKILNVRNSTPTAISDNKIVTDIIQALNIKMSVDYRDEAHFKTLMYGRLMLLTDADNDGIHISSLILNLFHYLFPTVLQRKDPFIVSMLTPIVRVFKAGPSNKDLLFYDERKYHEYARSAGSHKKKYYKGLGTTKPEDVPDTFGARMIAYIDDDTANAAMTKVFDKKYANERKEWLEKYDKNKVYALPDKLNDDCIPNVNISSFIDDEMIKFSLNDCKRSIPHLMDGLKESQRKVLYAVFKRNLSYKKEALKVAQLGGYVAEHTNYHHGEQNLFDTIIKMADEYVGSNNIPLLYRDGMFNTRLNGKDAASARYIFTKQDMLTQYIFRAEDNPLLTYNTDDDVTVEPVFYVPIIPMVLVNGCKGIGTGWSSNIPCYNPEDLISVIKQWLNSNDKSRDYMLQISSHIVPWYRNFSGTIESNGKNKYITKGVIERGDESTKNKKKQKDTNKVTIKELPVYMWTDTFKEFCETLVESKAIVSFSNYSTPRTPKFVITESRNGINCTLDTLKLHSHLSTSNMVLFDDNDKVVKYDTIGDILYEFCIIRFRFYSLRKTNLEKQALNKLNIVKNKSRFINDVITGKLKVLNVSEKDIIAQLKHLNFSENSDKDDDEGLSYGYLLRMQVRTFSKERINELNKEVEDIEYELTKIRNRTEAQMWINDLDSFMEMYKVFLNTCK